MIRFHALHDPVATLHSTAMLGPSHAAIYLFRLRAALRVLVGLFRYGSCTPLVRSRRPVVRFTARCLVPFSAVPSFVYTPRTVVRGNAFERLVVPTD